MCECVFLYVWSRWVDVHGHLAKEIGVEIEENLPILVTLESPVPSARKDGFQMAPVGSSQGEERGGYASPAYVECDCLLGWCRRGER